MELRHAVEDELVGQHLAHLKPGEMTPAEFDRWMARGSVVDALDDAVALAAEAGVGLGELVDCLTRRYYLGRDLTLLAGRATEPAPAA
jgi:hypothetical protein